MSKKSDLYAHSDPPELLETHLLNVNHYALTSLEEYKHAFHNPDLYDDIYTALNIITKFHDLGKATSFFQRYLLCKDPTVSSEDKTHSLSSAFLALFYSRSIPFKNRTVDFPIVIFLAIERHHSNLRSFQEEVTSFGKKIELITKQIDHIDNSKFEILLKNVQIELNLKNFKDFLTNDIKKYKHSLFAKQDMLLEAEIIENYFYINLLFSLLLDADKTKTAMPDKSIQEHIDLPSEVVDNYKIGKFKDVDKSNRLNAIRENIYQEPNDYLKNHQSKKILSINVPTGTGKTLAAYNFTIKLREKVQKEKKYTPKVIYALPFISIIDQNSSEFETLMKKAFDIPSDEVLPSNILLNHHSLSEVRSRNRDNRLSGDGEAIQNDDADELEEVNKSLLLTELWESDFVFTTYVQFLNTIFTNRNSILKRFHKLIGSIIVLDEIQSIPKKYWKLVNESFKFLSKEFGIYFVLMTATMPLIFDEAKSEIYELVTNKQLYFADLNRIQLKINLEPILFSNFKEKIVSELAPKKNYLFVLNTIKSSQELYRYLKEKLGEEFQLYYLSTRIIPKHRKERINQIKELIQNKKKNIVLISTQLIEAGVDLDFDIVYRDFAPLDCINQTAGRCNRNSSSVDKGTVHIVKLIDDIGKENPRSYFCGYVYDSILLAATENTLKQFEPVIPENKFLELNRTYFIKVNEVERDEIEWLNSIYHLNYFSDNKYSIGRFSLISKEYETIDLFIVPTENNEESLAVWAQWESIMSSREIQGFKRKLEVQKIKSKFSQYVISIPKKLIPEALVNGKYIMKWTDEIVCELKYDLQLGFYLSSESSDTVI